MSITDTTGRTGTGPLDGEGLDDLAGHIDLTEAARPEAPAPLEQVITGGPTNRPTFTITDAAVACAVSRKTITRKLGDLAEHGAAKDDDGVWRIPVEALLAVGLHPGRSLMTAQAPAPRPAAHAPIQTPAARPEHVAGDMVTVSRDRWDDLRIRLARAEAEASERALALADARLALRALTAAPAAQPARAEHVLPVSQPPVGGWFGATELRPAASTEEDVARGSVSPPEGAAGPDLAMDPVADSATDSANGSRVGVVDDGAAGDARSGPAVATAGTVLPDPAAEIASARSQAARTGGYVPAAGSAKGSKRRWWHSK